MNFIRLYIGDYMRDTGALSVTEHGAYMLMLLHHYGTEKPLPEGRELYRLLRAETKAERDAIDNVVRKFWQQGDGGIVNGRAGKEMARAEHQREVNRTVGKMGGRPKRTETESVSESLTESEPNKNPNQTPDTRHQTEIPSEAKASGGKPPTDRDMVFANGITLLTAAGVTDRNARSFLAAQCKAHGEPAVLAVLDDCARAGPIQPIPWLQAALAGKPKARKTDALMAGNIAAAQRFLASESAHD